MLQLYYRKTGREFITNATTDIYKGKTVDELLARISDSTPGNNWKEFDYEFRDETGRVAWAGCITANGEVRAGVFRDGSVAMVAALVAAARPRRRFRC